MKQVELTLSLRQMSAMLQAGIPIVDTLHFLGRSLNPGWREVYAELAVQVARGSYLSAAMTEHPGFPPYVVALVKVGEQSGSLVLVLSQLATYLERGVSFRRRMLAALTYPAVLLVVSLGLLGLLSYALLPTMVPFFQQLGVPLPGLTRWVLWVTRFLASPGALLGVILLVVTLLLVRRQLAEAEEDSDLRRGYDRLLLELPVLGPLWHQIICARTLRMLGLTGLLGLELSRSLKLLGGVAANTAIGERIQRARHDVHDGVPLSQAFATHKLFHRGVHAMLLIGEETGRMPVMCGLMADLYDQDVELSLTRSAALAEPIILLVTSSFVGLLCVATMLPWLTLMKSLV